MGVGTSWFRRVGLAGAAVLGAVGLTLAALAGAQSQPTARQAAYPQPTCDTNKQILDTKITKHPPKHTSSHKARFEFKAVYCNSPQSEATNGKFKCNLDGHGYNKCDSPKVYRGLKRGTHKFKVKATGAKFVDSGDPTPARFKWEIN